MRKFAQHFFAALLCLLSASCFEAREEIWIRADGSGRADLEYVVPASAMLLLGGEEGLQQRVRRLLEAYPELKLDELGTEVRGNDVAISLTASTDSMLTLIDLPKGEAFRSLPAIAKDLAGSFDVRINGLDVRFDRQIDVGGGLGLAALAINREQRELRQLVQIIHLPAPASSHNATRTTDKGRTLIWEHRLGEALKAPISTSFVMRIPLPWWAVALGLAAIAIPLLLMRRWWRRRKTA